MSSRALLGIAALLVLGLIVLLWSTIDMGSSDAAAKSTVAARRPVATTAGADRPAPAPAPAAVPVTPRARPPAVDGKRDEPAPSLEAPAPAAPKDPVVARADAVRAWMKEPIIASEQAVLDCLGNNPKLEGYATIPFRVSKKEGKVVVEAQPADATTFSDPAIAECIRGATQAMKYESLPAGVASVSSYRKIIVKDGALVENWLGPHEETPSGHK